MKRPLDKSRSGGFRAGFQKPQPWAYSKSGGAQGDDSMERMEEFLQAGSGVDETEENVGVQPNEKFLNAEHTRNLRKGIVEGPGRDVII